jgi:hypothetical protein
MQHESKAEFQSLPTTWHDENDYEVSGAGGSSPVTSTFIALKFTNLSLVLKHSA